MEVLLQGEDGNEDGEDSSATLGGEGAGVVGVAGGRRCGDRWSSGVASRGRGGSSRLGGGRSLSGRGGLGLRGGGGGSSWGSSGSGGRAGAGAGAGTRARCAGAGGAAGLRDGGGDLSSRALRLGVGVELALLVVGARPRLRDTVGEGLLEGGLPAQASSNVGGSYIAAGAPDIAQGTTLSALRDDVEGVRLRNREGGGDEDGDEGDRVLHFDCWLW